MQSNTSGSVSYRENRDQIITRALRICSAVADEELPTNSMTANAAQALNSMVKQWNAIGIHLWTTTEGVLFPQPGQVDYKLNPDDPAADNAAENWRLSTLLTPMFNGDTDVNLADISDYGLTDILVGDRIGFVMDDRRVYWTLVSNLSPLQINPPMIDPGTQGGSYVFIYREKISQPLRVISMRRFLLSVNPDSRIDTPMLVYSRLDYREMPNKTTRGTPTAFFYDPQLVTGYVHLWPAPTDVSAVFRFTWYRRIQDFLVADNTPDLPQEWINTLSWNLAKEIAPEYDVPLPKYQNMILVRAAETLDMVTGWDREPESTFFGVAFTPSSR